MTHRSALLALAGLLALAACGRGGPPITQPAFTPAAFPLPDEAAAMQMPALPPPALLPASSASTTTGSLWTGGRGSLLGDNRAMTRGDILTVVIEIDEGAEISNSTDRSRQGSEEMGVQALFGLPEALEGVLPGGATLSPAVGFDSQSQFEGEGSVRRAEELTLRVAATVTDVLPNGVLQVSGSQEVRVNNELRELLVTGFVRPADVSRQNEITYDNLAQARISYGGRGQITDVQQPRVGQQAAGHVLPF